jgi:putative aldouronate transport system permease protein
MTNNMIRQNRQDRLFTAVNYTFATLAMILVLYPLWFMIIASVSDFNQIYAGNVWLIPKSVTLEGYSLIFADQTIWRSYLNTILYTVSGTLISVTLTMTAGFALARRELKFQKGIMLFFIITMYFTGGMIPTYLLIESLGWLDTIWAIIIPNTVAVWNLIIARSTYMNTIPESLVEAGKIDGANYFILFRHIYLPLSSALIVLLIIFYAVGFWNSYLEALIYLKSETLFPLQLILRRILIQNSASVHMIGDVESYLAKQRATELIKYGMIIVSSAPILIAYPFLQKYFAKGTLVGSLKG